MRSLAIARNIFCGMLVTAAPISAGVIAPSAPVNVYAVAISQARTLLQKDLGYVPGASIAVAVDGRVVWSEGFGYADLATKRPVTTETRFRIASISKPLTSVGLMRLVERGQLDLDAPIQTYVPTFPVPKEGTITTRLAAGHLAGIRHYKGRETRSNHAYPNVTAGLEIFAHDPLLSSPGARFHYSSYGWDLISAAMEGASHREFLDYMQREVFDPLHLTHTGPNRAGVEDPALTHFYDHSLSGRYVPAPDIDVSYKWAGGGFVSTPEDLVRFGSVLLRPGFLKPESLSALFTSQKTRAGKPTNYGIGWFIGRAGKSGPTYFHTGGIIGSTTILLIRPHSRVVVALVCNVTNSSIIQEAFPIADLFAIPPAPAHAG